MAHRFDSKDHPVRQSGSSPIRESPDYSVLLGWLFLLFLALPALAAEHPGVLDRQDTCSNCHADKFKGKSVHSALALPCTVCHVAQTRGDMTTMELLMPKEQICFACHAKSSESEDHNPPVKGTCVSCHDSHATPHRMLLRQASDSHISIPIPSGKHSATPKSGINK